jgi:small conductance mechanosensitive channel
MEIIRSLAMPLNYFNLSFLEKGTVGYQLFVLLILLLLLKIFFKLIIYKLFSFILGSPSVGKEAARVKGRTIALLLNTTGNIVILGVAVFLALELLGIDIRPLLAGAGILGLAVGFGSQTLIKDLVSGIFIILENQYNVGDVIKIGIYEGKVKKISFRSTVIEDENGGMVYISNGSIVNVVNLTQRKIAK